jgi:iron complex outermembrane receptor protein
VLPVLVSFFATAKNTPDDLPDTTINISAVTIASDRLQQFGIGNKTETLDSSQKLFQQSGSLTDVLQNESAVFIRSYGIGGLATVSIRGAATTQTAILWNGFNLQSPMNSLFDLSLIPTFFLDEVKVQHGSAGALFGSGAIGGSIHLNSETKFDNGLKIKYAGSYGSFGNWMQGGSVAFSNKRWHTITRAFYHAAENDFKFQNIAEYGKPEQTLGNAALKQYGVLHEQSFNIAKHEGIKNGLSFKLWRQWNESGIPPTMTTRESQQEQKDGLWRATAAWEFSKRKWETVWRNAYFNEQIFFKDASINLKDDYNAHTFISEWENKIRLGKRHVLNIGASYNFNRALSDNYKDGNPTLHRGAAFASYKYESLSEKIIAVASVRKEVINHQWTPFTPSFAAEYKMLQWWRWKANVSANFKVPNFNDWYWTLGGNPDLKSEQGWGEEIGMVLQHSIKKIEIKSEITGFSNTVNNRIVWLPNEIGIWTPENVESVWSRGMESSFDVHYRNGNFKVGIKGSYQLVKATTGKDIAQKNEAGKQLIYTPLHRALFQFTLAYKKTSLLYVHQLNGEMFVTADNKKALPFYQVANVTLSQNVTFKSYALNVYAKANNIFNTAYQVIAWRPMPPANFEIGLQFSFHHKPLKN